MNVFDANLNQIDYSIIDMTKAYITNQNTKTIPGDERDTGSQPESHQVTQTVRLHRSTHNRVRALGPALRRNPEFAPTGKLSSDNALFAQVIRAGVETLERKFKRRKP